MEGDDKKRNMYDGRKQNAMMVNEIWWREVKDHEERWKMMKGDERWRREMKCNDRKWNMMIGDEKWWWEMKCDEGKRKMMMITKCDERSEMWR